MSQWHSNSDVEGKRDRILLVNPPNSFSRASFTDLQTTYPHLGLLTIATATQHLVEQRGSAVDVCYLDGALHGAERLREYIVTNAPFIKAIGLSAYAYNYGACLDLAKLAKRVCPKVCTVLGNDHFSALSGTILRNQAEVIDVGFVGNDIVESASRFLVDVATGVYAEPWEYAGLAYRAGEGKVSVNVESKHELRRLPSVRYRLMDGAMPHSEAYVRNQHSVYKYMAEEQLRGTVVDIGRGCLKFAGPRTLAGVPLNACVFCAIIPGAAAVAQVDAARAWNILHNAYEAGYNYLFVTADELPETFWPILLEMTRTQPAWYRDMAVHKRPQLMCYARADAFAGARQERIEILMRELRVNHFIVGFDAFTPSSLAALNKGLRGRHSDYAALSKDSLRACSVIARQGGRLTAGAVVTHLGITRAMLEANFVLMREMLDAFGQVFAELDFELLAPIPGSLAFEYMTTPGAAAKIAAELGVSVDVALLESLHEKYANVDMLDPEELVQDFIAGCCPDIDLATAYEYLERIRELVEAHGIPFECSSLGVGV